MSIIDAYKKDLELHDESFQIGYECGAEMMSAEKDIIIEALEKEIKILLKTIRILSS